ncbi:hypothetical protein [Lactiplantibacillus pentosus]|nr:hypothetical protein [Lactiplantibacillus pentosus]
MLIIITAGLNNVKYLLNMELPYFWLYLMLVAATFLHGLAPTADNQAP